MTVNLVDEFTQNIQAKASSVGYGKGHLLAVPWTVGYSQAVQIYVEQIDADLFFLTDRGMAADSLGDFDVDLSKPKMFRSWRATIRQGYLAPPMFVDTDDLEIATTVTRDKLGEALTSLGETIVRTDGLRALTRRRSVSFRERSMARAHEVGLTVVPRPTISGRYDDRQVSFGIEIAETVQSFIETIAARSGLEEIDRARIVFGDAESVDWNRKIALVSSDARVKPRQIEALHRVARVVDELGQDAYFEELAA